MPQENVKALRAAYAAWERGNFRTGVGLLDKQILFILRPRRRG
jgi:hypothetical protein